MPLGDPFGLSQDCYRPRGSLTLGRNSEVAEDGAGGIYRQLVPRQEGREYRVATQQGTLKFLKELRWERGDLEAHKGVEAQGGRAGAVDRRRGFRHPVLCLRVRELSTPGVSLSVLMKGKASGGIRGGSDWSRLVLAEAHRL